MARYKMDDGTVVDTALAQFTAYDKIIFDSRNQVSNAGGGQIYRETLHLSKRGRWYIESRCNVIGAPEYPDYAGYISAEEAVAWIVKTGNEIPDELKEAEEAVVE